MSPPPDWKSFFEALFERLPVCIRRDFAPFLGGKTGVLLELPGEVIVVGIACSEGDFLERQLGAIPVVDELLCVVDPERNKILVGCCPNVPYKQPPDVIRAEKGSGGVLRIAGIPKVFFYLLFRASAFPHGH